jgi:hypothetical protein
MSKEWIRLHGICPLPRRSGSARSIVTAPMAIVEFIYGLKDKGYIGIPRRYFV